MTTEISSGSPALRVATREWRRITGSRMFHFYLVGLPLILFVLLADIYKNRVVVDIPMAICDADHSELSRLLARSFDADRSLKIVAQVGSLDEAVELLRGGTIQGAIYIPADLEADIKHGKSARVVIYQNSSNIIIGNLITKGAVTVTRTISTGIVLKKIRALGASEQQALDLANPIRLDTDALYNPGYSYSSFLVPALLAVILQMIVMISAAQVVGIERHDGTLAELQAISQGSTFAALVGKALPHLAIHFVSALVMVGLMMPLFAIPFQGSIIVGILFLFFFLLTAFAVGMAISVIFKDPLFATELAAFINTPAFMFSGYTFPIAGMLGLHVAVAQALPFTHFLSGFIKLYQMGAPATALLPETMKLSLFLIGAIIAMALVGSRRLRPQPTAAASEAR